LDACLECGAKLGSSRRSCKNSAIRFASRLSLLRQAFLYDQYNNRTVVSEKNFDGSELRRTEIAYLGTYGPGSISYDGIADYTTTGNPGERVGHVFHIRNVPKQGSVIVGGGEVSRVKYEFDQPPLSSRASATQRLGPSSGIGVDLYSEVNDHACECDYGIAGIGVHSEVLSSCRALLRSA
jgi:hypothetical protein